MNSKIKGLIIIFIVIVLPLINLINYYKPTEPSALLTDPIREDPQLTTMNVQAELIQVPNVVKAFQPVLIFAYVTGNFTSLELNVNYNTVCDTNNSALDFLRSLYPDFWDFSGSYNLPFIPISSNYWMVSLPGFSALYLSFLDNTALWVDTNVTYALKVDGIERSSGNFSVEHLETTFNLPPVTIATVHALLDDPDLFIETFGGGPRGWVADEGEKVKVLVTAFDDQGVDTVSLNYSVNGGNWIDLQLQDDPLMTFINNFVDAMNVVIDSLNTLFGAIEAALSISIPELQHLYRPIVLKTAEVPGTIPAGSYVQFRANVVDVNGSASNSPMGYYYVVDKSAAANVLIIDPHVRLWLAQENLVLLIEQLISYSNYTLPQSIIKVIKNMTVVGDLIENRGILPRHNWENLGAYYNLYICEPTTSFPELLQSFKPDVIILSNLWLGIESSAFELFNSSINLFNWDLAKVTDDNGTSLLAHLINYTKNNHAGIIATHGTLSDWTIWTQNEKIQVGTKGLINNTLNSLNPINEETLAALLGMPLITLFELIRDEIAKAIQQADQTAGNLIGSLPLQIPYFPFNGSMTVDATGHPIVAGVPSDFNVTMPTILTDFGINAYTQVGWQLGFPQYIAQMAWNIINQSLSAAEPWWNNLTVMIENVTNSLVNSSNVSSIVDSMEWGLNSVYDALTSANFTNGSFDLYLNTTNLAENLKNHSIPINITKLLSMIPVKIIAHSDDWRAGITCYDKYFMSDGYRSVYFSFEPESSNSTETGTLLKNAIDWTLQWEYNLVEQIGELLVSPSLKNLFTAVIETLSRDVQFSEGLLLNEQGYTLVEYNLTSGFYQIIITHPTAEKVNVTILNGDCNISSIINISQGLTQIFLDVYSNGSIELGVSADPEMSFNPSYLHIAEESPNSINMQYAMGAGQWLISEAIAENSGFKWEWSEGVNQYYTRWMKPIGQFLINLYSNTRNITYLNYAKGWAQWLIGEAIPENSGYKWESVQGNGIYEPNVYEGAAAVGKFFLALYQITGNLTYLNYGNGAFQWVISKAVAKNGGYKWFYNDTGLYHTGINYGAAGIGSEFLNAYQITNNATYLTYADGAAQWLTSVAVSENSGYKWDYAIGSNSYKLGYTWGTAGVGEFFLKAYQITGNSTYLDHAYGAAQWVISQAKPQGGGYYWNKSPSASSYLTDLRGVTGDGRFLLHAYLIGSNFTYLQYAEGAGRWLSFVAVNESGGFKWNQSDIGAGHYNPADEVGIFFKELFNVTGNDTYNHYYEGQKTWLISTAIADSGGYHWVYNGDWNFTYGVAKVGDFFLTFIEPPNAPILYSITQTQNKTLVELDWSDATGTLNYYVYRNSTNIISVVGLQPIAVVNSSQYQDVISANGTYYYVIVAGNIKGNSSISNCENITIELFLSNGPLLYPIFPTTDYDGKISLEWETISDANLYNIYRDSSYITSIVNLTAIDSVNTTQYQDTITLNGTYYYVIVAENASGASPISNCVSVDVNPQEWYRTWGTNLIWDVVQGVAAINDSIYFSGSTNQFDLTGDAILVKYNSIGEQIWNRSWGQVTAEDRGNDVAVDGSGNVYLGGYVEVGSHKDALLVKYDSVGNQLWNVTWDRGLITPDDDIGKSVAVDEYNNVYIAGLSNGLFTKDAFLVKYDSAGNWQWEKIWDGGFNDEGLAVTVDENNNTYLAGYTDVGALNLNFFLVKYDSGGTWQWERKWGGSGEDKGNDIIVVGTNNIYVVGYMDIGSFQIDAYLAKYDSSGNQLWNRTWGGSNEDKANAVAIDSIGSVYMVGHSDLGLNIDSFIVKYNSSGQEIRNWYWGGSGEDRGYGVTVDGANIYTVGFTKSFTDTIGGDAFLTKNILDSQPPQFSNEMELLSSPQIYGPSQYYQFNLTITDNYEVDTVLFEWDGNNYTVNTHSNSEFYFDLFDLAVASYQYQWYFNDTLNNWNSTSSQLYEVQKATPNLELYLNGTANNYTYGVNYNVNITVSSSISETVSLYLNETFLTSAIAPYNYVTNLSQLGKYNITAFYSGSSNYTSAQITRWAIEDSQIPTYSNEGQSLGSPQTYDPAQRYQFNITLIDNLKIDTIYFEWDGFNYTVTTHSNNEYYFELLGIGGGNYQYGWHFNDTANNWNSTGLNSYEIQKATPSIYLYLNGTLGNYSYSLIENARIVTIMSANLPVEIYINSSFQTNGTSPLGYTTGFVQLGSYNISAIFPGNANYTRANTSQWAFTVPKSPNAPILDNILPNPNIDGIIQLNWSDVIGASNYYVYRNTSTITSVSGLVPIASGALSIYQDTVTSNGTYYYVIVAGNATGNSSISNCESVVVAIPSAVPSAPGLGTILPNPDNDGIINLNWSDVIGASIYHVYRNTSSITSVIGLTPITSGALSNYQDTVTINGTYYYVIVAGNATGNSSISNCESVVVAIPPAVLNAPALDTILPNPDNDGIIDLNWNDVSGATYYYVYRGTVNITSVDGLIPITVISESQYEDTVTSNEEFYYVIMAGNAVGNSSISNCESVTINLLIDPLLDWYRTWGGNNDWAENVAVDSNNNIYLAGRTDSFGSSDYDAFLAKYAPNGTLLWDRVWGRFEVNYHEYGIDVAVDGNNNIYLTGHTSYAGSAYAFLVKYDSDGNQLWNRTWGGVLPDVAFGIAVDNNDYIYLVGHTQNLAVGGIDTFLIKYDSNGNNLWNRTWGGINDDTAKGVAIDDTNNIYVTGYYSPGAGNDVFLLKYNTGGTLLWNRTWDGSADDRGWDVTIDNDNDIYITGEFYNISQAKNDLLLINSTLQDNKEFEYNNFMNETLISDINGTFFLTI